MNLEGFCHYNGIVYNPTFSMMVNCRIPSEEVISDSLAILYTTSGNAIFKVDGVEHKVGRRYISFMRNNSRFSLVSCSDNFRVSVLVLGLNYFREVTMSNALMTLFIMDDKPFLKVTHEYSESLRICYEALDNVSKFVNNPYRDECAISILKALFYSTGYHLFTSLNLEGDDFYELTTKYTSYEGSVVAKFLSLLEIHSATERTLGFYASHLGYNPKYLSAVLKKETGRTGQSIIDQYAVFKAMIKLSYSDKSIKEISNEMEFPSQSDFGKFFKRVTGESPIAFRKSRRANRFSR